MKTIRNLFASVKYRKQTLILLIAIAGLSCITMKMNAQCTQPPGMEFYSRVINDAFKTGNWLQADYDHTSKDIYVPSTYTSGGTNYVFWADVHPDGIVNTTKAFSITSNSSEKTMAIKKSPSNGDVIVAGTIVTTGSPAYTVLYIMRTGTISWCYYFNQNTTAITNHVVLTETTNGDIVAASSSLSGTDDIVIVRLSSAGTLLYYDDRPIAVGSNSTESHPAINGICATINGGFVLVGSTGYSPGSPDFIAAMVMQFDSNYSGAIHSHFMWNYLYRSYRSSYSFSSSSNTYNSATYANAVSVDTSSNILTIVGYTSDCDQNGANATFEHGILFALGDHGQWMVPASHYHRINEYSHATNEFIRFTGVTSNWYQTYVTGTDSDGITGTVKTLVSNIQWPYSDPPASTANIYGTNSKNKSFSITTVRL